MCVCICVCTAKMWCNADLNYVGVNLIGVSKLKVYLIIKTMSVCGNISATLNVISTKTSVEIFKNQH